ncbi:MAG TPA: metallophosphoesterase [Lachnospiraceae bacterium]|nr:metallophosphoesterase [Lachnospiraceae bacterium]
MVTWMIEIAIVILLFFVVIIIVDTNRFVIIEQEIYSPKVQKDYSFVVLSDLHNKSYGKNNKRLMKAIQRLKPDSVIVAGDMITGKKGDGYQNAISLMEGLALDYPIFYGNGNHEYRMRMNPEYYGSMYDDYVSQLNRSGVALLMNKKKDLLQENIVIHGLEIDRKYFNKFKVPPMEDSYLEKLLGKTDQKKFQILIAHNPDFFPKYAKWGADLVLSGHIHGGVINLPFLGGVISPTFHLFPKYDGGLYEIGKSKMILSRGLGTHTVPIRMFNPGEVIFVKLKMGEK